MSWIVPWNGVDYDVDPTEFSGLELAEIKKRTGLSFKNIIAEIADLDADAIRSLFWTVDRRSNPDLLFSDYHGPSLKVVIPHLANFNEVMDDLGKAATPTSSTSGSPPSPSDSDTPQTSTRD